MKNEQPIWTPLFSPLAPLREAKFCIIPKQDPARVLSFAKKNSNFVVSWGIVPSALHI